MIFNNVSEVFQGAVELAGQTSNSPDIVRIIEDPRIEKHIKLDELSIPDYDSTTDPAGEDKKENELGLVYPLIRINDVVLARHNLSYMEISLAGFMPTIKLSLIFDNSSFTSKNMPKDGDMISLFLRSSTSALQYFRNDFIITSCDAVTGSLNQAGARITLTGRLFVDSFDSKTSTKAITGTSKTVLREIAKMHGLGFAFNDYDDTNDFMNWIQCREPGETFVNHIIRHSWKDDTSFFSAWVDMYYNLCFVNINKFLLSTENEEDVDITFASKTIHLFNQMSQENDSSVGNTKMAIKTLTNMGDMQGTPFFIKSWRPVNNSSAVSINNGYETESYTYIHNQNLINDLDADCFETLSNRPAFDQNKVDSYILLRGRATYDAAKNPEDEQARVNYDFVGSYNNTVWTGIEYAMNDDDKNKEPQQWSGNVHRNYNRAPYHNKQNFAEINKMYITVVCDGLNLQIMKGERIPVLLFFPNTIDNMQHEMETNDTQSMSINRFYSGYYLVTNITYKYNPNNINLLSPYETHFELKRREWPVPEPIQKDETANKTNTNQQNNNTTQS